MAASPPNPARAATETTSATFQKTSANLYAPELTLSINDNIRFLENIKHCFKRTVFLE